MAKLHKFFRNIDPLRKIIGDKTYDKLHPLGTGLMKAATPSAPPPVVPMPDEEAIQRARRRSLATQLGRTGRASTILTGQGDRLGP